MFASVSRLFWISRPILWLNTLGPGWIGLWLTGKLWSLEFLPILFWLSLPFNLLIYGVNDISDREVDAISERKGGLEGSKLDAKEVSWLYKAIAFTNLPFFIYFVFVMNLSALAWISAYIAVFLAYSMEPIRFKARPLLDALSNAAYAFPIVWVAFALEDSPQWPAALGMMAWCVAKQTYDSIQDIEDDRRFFLKTTAVSYGIKFCLFWCSFWWLLSSWFFSQISQSVAIVNLIYAVGLIVALASKPDPKRAHELYKFSIGFPYVAGTFAGVLLALAVFLGRWPL